MKPWWLEDDVALPSLRFFTASFFRNQILLVLGEGDLADFWKKNASGSILNTVFFFSVLCVDEDLYIYINLDLSCGCVDV